MKIKVLFLLLLAGQILSAQTFTEKPFSQDLKGISFSSIAFSDVDGDGDEDVLVSGTSPLGQVLTRLYTNDGMGNFAEPAGTSFPGVTLGSVAFSDVNGDDNEDIFIMGIDTFGFLIAELYTNDGQGSFTEVMDTPFEGFIGTSVDFADVNGDGSEDLLVTGAKNIQGFGTATILYLNDGQGNFTEVMNTPFEDISFGSIAFSDVNNDGSVDVLITGAINPAANDLFTGLYLNDGEGNFTEVTGTPFQNVMLSSVAFSDVNGDNSVDVMVTGVTEFAGPIARLYFNDGQGNFTELPGTPFSGVVSGSVAFSDVNGDGSEDVIIAGGANASGSILSTRLYTNDGVGNFTELQGTSFEGVWNGAIAVSDVNKDGKQDLLLSGNDNSQEPTLKLYINDGVVASTDLLKRQQRLSVVPFPNPATSNNLQVNYTAAAKGEVTIRIFDAKGVLWKQERTWTVKGPQLLTLDIATLSPGNYFLQVDNAQNSGIAKFVVQ